MNNKYFRRVLLFLTVVVLLLGFFSKNQEIQKRVFLFYLILLIVKVVLLLYRFIIMYYNKEQNIGEDIQSFLKSELPKFYCILMQEMRILKYVFVVWRKQKTTSELVFYSYTGNPNIVLYVAFFSILFIETFVVHIVLVKHAYFVLAKVSFLSSLYILVLLIAQVKALKFRPSFISNGELVINYGIITRQNFKLTDITVNRKPNRKKDLLSLGLMSQMELNNLFIELNKEEQISKLYGIKKKASEIGIFIEDKEKFIEAFNRKKNKEMFQI